MKHKFRGFSCLCFLQISQSDLSELNELHLAQTGNSPVIRNKDIFSGTQFTHVIQFIFDKRRGIFCAFTEVICIL